MPNIPGVDLRYENVTRAIELFSKLIEYGKTKQVDISTYNCRKLNFVHSPMAWAS